MLPKTLREVVRAIFGKIAVDKSEDISDIDRVMEHEHAILIDELGGGKVVAEALWGPPEGQKDRRVEAVYKWKQNGVPWRWRPAIAEMARKAGKQLPDDFLLPVASPAPSKTEQTAA